MARKIYAVTIEIAENREMKNILGMEKQAQAAMFLHYEIRIAFPLELLQQGFMKAPADFSKTGKTTRLRMSGICFS